MIKQRLFELQSSCGILPLRPDDGQLGLCHSHLGAGDIFIALRKDPDLASLDKLVRPVMIVSPNLSATELFRRFHRGDSLATGEGFGLGLAIVKRICEQAGWKVSIERRAEGGTRVLLALI